MAAASSGCLSRSIQWKTALEKIASAGSGSVKSVASAYTNGMSGCSARACASMSPDASIAVTR